MPPACSVCGKREAVYRRDYSGQNLCPICLGRTIERSIRKSIAEARVLSPGDTILLPITLSVPYYSQVLALLLPGLEKRHGSKVVVAVPTALGVGTGAVASRGDVVEVDVPSPRAYENPLDCIRYDRSWSLYYARKLGADAVAFPLTRTHLTLIDLEAVLQGRPEAISDSLLVVDSRPPVFNPLAGVEAETVAAYGIVRGVEPLDTPCRPVWASKYVYRSVARGRPELAFSMGKVSPRLAGLASRSMTRCRVCGGASPGPVCPSCKRTGALEYFSPEDPL